MPSDPATHKAPEDGLEDVAAHYSTAFPSARVDSFLAHLSVVRTGVSLSRAVSQFLAANFGINTARYSLLRALYFTDEKRLPQSEVAKAMNVTSPNVTQLIDALEREGLVERVVSETDRRVTLAQLTPSGLAKCSELVPGMAQFMEETSSGLDHEEMVQLIGLLEKVRAHVNDMSLDS